jgi:uncharacterized protein YbjQ (UPF0145 family)
MSEKAMRELSGGTLKGGYAPRLNVVQPRRLKCKKKYNIPVPKDKRAGDTMSVTIEGKRIELTIPAKFSHSQQIAFTYVHPGDVDKVIASTLPTVPGHEIVLSKPIIWGSVSFSFLDLGRKGQEHTGQQVGNLMQEVQEHLQSTAIDKGCNAVLGINFNVTHARSGERGNRSVLIVTAYGTPCSVIPSENLPIPSVEAVPYEDNCDFELSSSMASW